MGERRQIKNKGQVPFPVPRSGMRERARDIYVDMMQKHTRSILFLTLMRQMHEYRSDKFVQSKDNCLDDPVPSSFERA